MVQFKYRIIEVCFYSDPVTANQKLLNEDACNELGEQGWELVSVISPKHLNGGLQYYFKKQISKIWQ